MGACMHCRAPALCASQLCAACSARTPERRPSREVARAAKAARRQEHERAEAQHRAAVGKALGAPSAAAAPDLAPADFAAAVLREAGPGRPLRVILALLRARLGDGYRVNHQPIGHRELRQVACRLQRDGMAILDGDVLRAS